MGNQKSFIGSNRRRKIAQRQALTLNRLAPSRSEIIKPVTSHRDQDNDCDAPIHLCFGQSHRESIRLPAGDERASRHYWPKQIRSLMRREAQNSQPNRKPAKKKTLQAPFVGIARRVFGSSVKAIKREETPRRCAAQIIENRLIK